jgi:hypothetical protein
MTWVRLDDGFTEHPKVKRISSDALRLFLRGLCYANRYLTDGRLTFRDAHELAALKPTEGAIFVLTHEREDLIDELVSARLWERDGTDFVIHDYADYQPTREEVLAEREKTRARVSRFRGRGNAVRNGTPDPTRPSPQTPRSESNEHLERLFPPEPSEEERAGVLERIKSFRIGGDRS